MTAHVLMEVVPINLYSLPTPSVGHTGPQNPSLNKLLTP